MKALREVWNKKIVNTDFSLILWCSSPLQCESKIPEGSPSSQRIYQIFQSVFNQFLGYQVLGRKALFSTLW